MAPPEELVVFCRREHPRLVGALTLYCGDRALAEEIAQDALATVCERWEQVRRMAAPGAWAHRAAINAANSRFRRRAAGRRALRRLGGHVVEDGSDPDAAEAVAIRRAVATLPARQRETVVLRFYLQLSVAETALWMDATEAAVKSSTQRALAGLRDRLGLADDTLAATEVDDVTG